MTATPKGRPMNYSTRLALASLPALLVYLAGPMTGVEIYNFPAFARARARLRAQGARVVCPAEMDLAEGFDPTRSAQEQGFDERAALRRDLEALAGVDAIVFLPGWTRSAGALAEAEMARAIGLRAFEYDDAAGEPTVREIDLGGMLAAA